MQYSVNKQHFTGVLLKMQWYESVCFNNDRSITQQLSYSLRES